VPIFATPKVARDLHIEVARGLYSVPAELVGQRMDVRADTRLVKLFSRGQLVKTHPRVRPGGRSTDPKDYPVGRVEYALRDVATLTTKAAAAGPAVGVYATRLLEGPTAVDADADCLPAARPGPQLRGWASRSGVRAGVGARRRRDQHAALVVPRSWQHGGPITLASDRQSFVTFCQS
jgi:hypothetical protein